MLRYTQAILVLTVGVVVLWPRLVAGRWRDEDDLGNDQTGLGGEHRWLLVRPCARWAGDGLSGLPRRLVTGNCCGDGTCSQWEKNENCPQDCSAPQDCNANQQTPQQIPDFGSNTKHVQETISSLFGPLKQLTHGGYHCEGSYDEDGNSWCSRRRTESPWLVDLLKRDGDGTLPFKLPGKGATAVEFGAGNGQDSRNMAKLAGWSVTAVDVVPEAISRAKRMTPPDMLGGDAGQIDFVAYDVMGLPEPQRRVDFLFDATTYCGLRHVYLARFYDVWRRIATPGHTLLNIQCWQMEFGPYKVPKSRRDMEADFEPVFHVLHSETCVKNQGGLGWCFYLRLRDPAEQDQLLTERLKVQQAVRSGDLEYARKASEENPNEFAKSGMTLYHIARTHKQQPLMDYLLDFAPKEPHNFSYLLPDNHHLRIYVYGTDENETAVKELDRIDSALVPGGQAEMEMVRDMWERAEEREFRALEEHRSKHQKLHETSVAIIESTAEHLAAVASGNRSDLAATP